MSTRMKRQWFCGKGENEEEAVAAADDDDDENKTIEK